MLAGGDDGERATRASARGGSSACVWACEPGRGGAERVRHATGAPRALAVGWLRAAWCGRSRLRSRARCPRASRWTRTMERRIWRQSQSAEAPALAPNAVVLSSTFLIDLQPRVALVTRPKASSPMGLGRVNRCSVRRPEASGAVPETQINSDVSVRCYQSRHPLRDMEQLGANTCAVPDHLIGGAAYPDLPQFRATARGTLREGTL